MTCVRDLLLFGITRSVVVCTPQLWPVARRFDDGWKIKC